MSDVLLDFEKKSLEFQLKVTESPLSYIKQQCVQESRIALAIYIPYPILMKWHELVGIKDERGNELNYIDLLNFWIPGRWFKVSKENGSRIHGRLRREAGAVVNKYTGKKVSGSKREEANRKGLTLNIYETELVVPHEIEENLSAAEQEIKEWKLRYKDLEKEKESLARGMMEAIRRKENEMGETVKTTEEKFRDIEEKNKELSEYIQNLEKKTGFLCQGKTIDSLGKRQQSRRLKELKEKSEIALWFLESHGLKLSFLKVQEAATNEFHTLEFDQLSANETDQNNLETLLFLLDKFCASDELYHELSLLSEDLPRTYLIKQRRNELNKLCHIERTPGQYPGAQLSFSETLQDHIKQFLESNSNHKGDEPIKVKISCDGAKMSRSANFMIMSFSLLQTGDLVMSSKGNRTIGVVNGPEKYETIETSFSEIINDINSVNKNGKIKVNDKEIAVELFLGGDYKFLLMAMGMSGATSDYACLWCKVHKLFRWDMSKDLSHYNEELKRTLQEIKELSSSSKKFSCVKSPLFTIELDHIILDELHLMLRVTDKLTENLITEVMEKDAKQDFNMARGKEKGVNLDILIKTINELGITFSLWEKKNADGKGSGTYDWTSLVGYDKKKLTKLLPAKLEELDILFPETKETVIKLWKDFYTLYSLINSDSNAGDFYLDIFQKSKDFVNLFCSLGGVRIGYEKKRVTPYMHALVYHVPMFIKNHKNFRQFTGQGIEKNNDDAKKIYFQKSNKWDAAQDVLLLEHRQEALKHCEREKRQYTKRKAAYWEDGIIETRKKRKRACLRELQNDHNGADVQGNNLSEDKYNKMTVKQLRQEIKSIGINVKGIAKLKKCQLVEILKQNQ